MAHPIIVLLLSLFLVSACQHKPESVPQTAGRLMVYITSSGKKYHLEGCTMLRKTKRKMELNEALKKGYTPCQICHPPSSEDTNK